MAGITSKPAKASTKVAPNMGGIEIDAVGGRTKAVMEPDVPPMDASQPGIIMYVTSLTSPTSASILTTLWLCGWCANRGGTGDN